MNIYDRTIKLIGQENQKNINDATVAVFGLGGVGGYAVEALARAGVGHLIVVDNDTVNETNINRQLLATSSTIGMLKTQCASDRIAQINSTITVTQMPIRLDETTVDQFDFASYDYVIDAIDTITSKVLMAKKCQNVTKLISSMGTGNKLDATKLSIADISQTSMCPLARVMRRLLKEQGITTLPVVYSTEQPRKTNTEPFTGKATPASISYVPAVAGLLLAQFVLRDLIEE